MFTINVMCLVTITISTVGERIANEINRIIIALKRYIPLVNTYFF